MPIKYFKGEPNVYVIQYRGGEIIKHGVGLSFFYFPVLNSIATVPIMTQDVPFIFNETTANFQDIAIQGQLTYRLNQPLNAAKILDFRIEPKIGRYRSKDPEKLQQRIINAVQSYTRGVVNRLSLEEALTQVKNLSSGVLAQVRQEAALDELGVIIESLYFTAVTATPEMKKALEAEYREGLQRKADQAIYARRAAAVEEERKIQESELGTEVGLEERRRDLVDLQGRNSLTLAEAEGKTIKLKLAPYNELDPQALIGLALKEWATNAGKIGNLHITPDLLTQLVTYAGRERK